jgi:hypothetical protein
MFGRLQIDATLYQISTLILEFLMVSNTRYPYLFSRVNSSVQ